MIDLHLHTNHSDGTDSVKELLEKAEKLKLELISVTDHDSIGAYLELEQRPEIRESFTGEIIPASEIKSIYDDINIEVLAYGIDYKRINIKTEDRVQIQNDILKHFIKVAKSLGLKIDESIKINVQDPTKLFASVVFYDEITKYKENEEIVKKLKSTRTSFYRRHEGNKNSPFYYNTSKYFDDLQTLIDKIHSVGGLAFLAHGLIYPFENKRLKVEEILKTTNIDGLECVYPLFTKEEMEFMINLCKKYNRYISGGSDYHGLNKPTTFMATGINNNIIVEKELIQDWVTKVRKI